MKNNMWIHDMHYILKHFLIKKKVGIRNINTKMNKNTSKVNTPFKFNNYVKLALNQLYQHVNWSVTKENA